MASNTGCTSDGDPAMTFRISAVPVWRSSASFVSWNRRAFWIAITAWSAKAAQGEVGAAAFGRIGPGDVDRAHRRAVPRASARAIDAPPCRLARASGGGRE